MSAFGLAARAPEAERRLADRGLDGGLPRRNSAAGADSLTALTTSAVTVPTPGFGIRPRGRIRRSAGLDHHVQGRGQYPDSNQFSSLILLLYSSLPAKSSARGEGIGDLVGLADDGRLVLRGTPAASPPSPRTIWSAYLG